MSRQAAAKPFYGAAASQQRSCKSSSSFLYQIMIQENSICSSLKIRSPQDQTQRRQFSLCTLKIKNCQSIVFPNPDHFHDMQQPRRTASIDKTSLGKENRLGNLL